jgi:hypothetical protein
VDHLEGPASSPVAPRKNEPRRLLSGVTAADDSYSVTLPADMPEPVTLDVLANDDGNGETPATTSVTSPANGSAWIETAAENGLGHDVIRVAADYGFDGVLTFSNTIGNPLEWLPLLVVPVVMRVSVGW